MASAFFKDTNGDIWFTLENIVVFRYDYASFNNLYKESGLIKNGVQSLYRDKENRF